MERGIFCWLTRVNVECDVLRELGGEMSIILRKELEKFLRRIITGIGRGNLRGIIRENYG